MPLKLTNTLTRKKEDFKPLDASNVRLYVCGVTPYDHSHIGHARVCVVYDILYRLLRHMYGAEHVTYVRNFTDIDDKIINRAAELGKDPKELADEMIESFHADMKALGCLPPTHEPRVSDPEVMAGIITFIEDLMKKDAAYATSDGIYLDISKVETLKKQNEGYHYGQLSGKKLGQLIAGARVEVKREKRSPGDFALWKFSKPEEPASVRFEASFGEGRPGWHIECSVMGEQLLGARFDIHGGGEDLQFPHHENELAQCVCRHGHIHANTWVHNAFITVDGKKMSKSDGNFVYIKDALRDEQGAPLFSGPAVRLWLLQTHYGRPANYSHDALEAAWQRSVGYEFADLQAVARDGDQAPTLPEPFLAALMDDLNTSKALSVIDKTKHRSQQQAMLAFLGIETQAEREQTALSKEEETLLTRRTAARAAKNWAKSDHIRDDLEARGIMLEDHPDGTTTWRRK
jgi:cysteinyl-tRNA synthetase